MSAIAAAVAAEVGHHDWYVYILECIDGTLYTGISTDVARRYQQHCRGKGARYTRARPPRQLLASFRYASQSLALRAEIRIKRLSAAHKRLLCAEQASNAAD